MLQFLNGYVKISHRRLLAKTKKYPTIIQSQFARYVAAYQDSERPDTEIQLEELRQRMSVEQICANDAAQLKGSSIWLTTLPLVEERYVLSKREFFDTIHLMSGYSSHSPVHTETRPKRRSGSTMRGSFRSNKDHLHPLCSACLVAVAGKHSIL
jgi:hypothetical protein